jgi:NAD(P)-dependent dehydrogenase (short-subunit alcohol dehydrogenase family)
MTDGGRVAGKVALITGGAYGIGRVYARALATEGASIVIADVDAKRTAATVAELEAEGRTALGVPCDVAVEDQVEAAVAAAEDRFGGVDILVNNAGVHLLGGTQLLEQPRDEWRRTWEVNVTGAINCAAAVRPSMRRRGGGVIVNQLSIAAYLPGGGPYFVTKQAGAALVTTFARELAADGIRVYGIAPGLVDSEAAMAHIPSERVEELVEQQLIQRLGRMEDLAKVLLFFCSDDAAFVTGETLLVGGGRPLRL